MYGAVSSGLVAMAYVARFWFRFAWAQPAPPHLDRATMWSQWSLDPTPKLSLRASEQHRSHGSWPTWRFERLRICRGSWSSTQGHSSKVLLRFAFSSLFSCPTPCKRQCDQLRHQTASLSGLQTRRPSVLSSEPWCHIRNLQRRWCS